MTRYNVDRFSLHLPPVVAFSREHWRRPVRLGYDSKLSPDVVADSFAARDNMAEIRPEWKVRMMMKMKMKMKRLMMVMVT